MNRLAEQIERLKKWYCARSLPLWATAGYDRARGGFFETLDFGGAPIADQPRRVRTQARQIHTFSQAAILGWYEEGETIAATGFDYLLRHAVPEEGARGCVHILSPDGRVIDPLRDLYDQAFLLLACASRWEAAKDERALTLAARTIDFMNNELKSTHGGWREDDAGSLPRRQNPHMHLFEAFCALYRVTGDPVFSAYADQIFQLFTTHFFDADNKVLREFFAADFALDKTRGDVFEPGHMVEWVWLLDKYAALKDAPIFDAAKELYESAGKTGRSPGAAPFLVNSCTLGQPPSGNRRLWPQTEYLKASLVMARHGDETAAEIAAAIIEAMFNSYLDEKVPGLWCDEFSASDARTANAVPASIPYHLHEAVACGDEFLKANS